MLDSVVDFIRGIFKMPPRQVITQTPDVKKLTVGSPGFAISHHIFLTEAERESVGKGKAVDVKGFCVLAYANGRKRERKVEISYRLVEGKHDLVVSRSTNKFKIVLGKAGRLNVQSPPVGAEFHYFSCSQQVTERKVTFPLFHQVIVQDIGVLEKSSESLKSS